MDVIIIGAGWAGLAAAVELAAHNVSVTVVERARQLGGRARSLSFNGCRIDNGQHILLGAYKTVLSLLSRLNIPEDRVFRRIPLDLLMRNTRGAQVHLHAPNLPAPLHMLWALLTMQGLPLSKRWAALHLSLAMQRNQFIVDPDVPLLTYLQQHDQGTEIIESLWQPLCLATLNTPIAQASTSLFLKVMADAFFDTRAASDLLVPLTDLGHCFPEGARDYIEQHGGSVRIGKRALKVYTKNGIANGVELEQEGILAEHVIIATAPRACHDLLQTNPALATMAAPLEGLMSLPICTLYLQYPENITLNRDFIGVLGATTQWLFDRGRLTGARGLFAAVISGPGEHMKIDNAALTKNIIAEIAALFPDWPPPSETKLIREKQATFSAYSDVNRLRPHCQTSVSGLWLAGDYTATGYPSTLEGAALSGVECARLILEQL